MSERVPPQNIEAEEMLLGAVLVANVLPAVLAEEGLEAGHFYRDRHCRIFEAAKALHDRGVNSDVTTVVEELKRRGDLDRIGGADVVAGLAAKVPAPGHATNYARIIVDNADLRRLDATAKQIQQSVADRDGDAAELIGRALSLLDESAPSGDPYLPPAKLADFVYEHAEGTREAGKLYPWPFDELNRRTGGVRTRQVVLIAGWTHFGKSVVAGQLLESTAKAGAKACLYFNEMDREEHTGGWLQRNWGVPSLRFIQQRLDERDRQRVLKALNHGPPPFGLCPIAGWDAYKVASHIRRHRFDIAVVDILHNIRYEDERDLSNAVSAFVEAAKLADCCIVLVSHLNRGRLHDNLRPRPSLRDIRGTGDLENKADIVCFVHREQDPDTGYPLPEGEIWLPKARGVSANELGGLEVQFDAERIRFLPVDRRFSGDTPSLEAA